MMKKGFYEYIQDFQISDVRNALVKHNIESKHNLNFKACFFFYQLSRVIYYQSESF